MLNGSFYTDVLCGPPGAEQLPFNTWALRYSHGFKEFDLDMVESFAAKMEERGEELSASEGGYEARAAAEAWFKRSPNPTWWAKLTNNEQTVSKDKYEQLAGPFYYHMCRIWRSTDAGTEEDIEPFKYANYATDSLSYITSKWAWDTCKRFRHEVFGPIARAAHDTALAVAMCIEGRVQCKKDFEFCLGTCSGDLTSNLKRARAFMIPNSTKLKYQQNNVSCHLFAQTTSIQ